MARKTCPQCKTVTGASSTTCNRCGHAFETVAVVVADRRPQRCAMCGIVNDRSVKRCQCGFEFDMPPEEARPFFQARRANAWFLLIGSIALGAVGLVILVVILLASPVIPVKGLVFAIAGVSAACAAGTRKAARILSATRINLDELDGKGEALPAARVVDRLPAVIRGNPNRE